MATMVSATGLGKRYWIRERRQSLAGSSYRWLTRRGSTHDSFWAIREVTFAVAAGESLGIIGPNGAGKSTLLKLIAGIARPSEGRASATGRVSTQFGLGAG